MILLDRKTALVFFFLFSVSILALGIYGYYAILRSGEEGSSAIEIKAENLLYMSVVCASVIIIAFLLLVGRTVYVSRELDKLIEINKYGDFSPELSMRRLGKIGEKITNLYYTLNSLNEKKSLKISALSELVEYAIQNIEVPLIVTDVLGTIVYASRRHAERFQINRWELVNTHVASHYPIIDYHDVILTLDKSRSILELEADSGPVSLIPVNNKMNALSYVIWIFDKGGLVAELSRNVEQTAKNSSRLLGRVFGRRNERR
ncbi:MAG: hypothetical protein CMN78_03625 [Spirochaetales bacterium]|nr:hypothetical protein [Spirochaetales bacterium]